MMNVGEEMEVTQDLTWWFTRIGKQKDPIMFPLHPPLHYGLTGGWVQNLKASYLPYFLPCAMVGLAIG